MIDDILIVDDSSTARMITQRCMEIAGYQNARFHEAANGIKALQFISEHKVDLFIVDLNMPEMDGLTLLGRLRNDPKYKETPVLVISSLLNEEKESGLKELGVFAVLTKPISPASVLKSMQKLSGDTNWGS